MKKILFGFCLSICCLVSGYAQIPTSSCAQTLRLARSTYELGRLHELPLLLDGCLKNGFTTQEKVDALKLLTQAYIYLNDPKKADESMLLLLQTDNYFEINEAIDPAEFVALYKTYRTTPIYRVGLKAGAVTAQPNVSTSDIANEGVGKYDNRFSFLAGISVEIPFTKKITLNPELYFQQKAFKNTNTLPVTDGDFALIANQTLTYISLPLAVQYHLLDHKLNPYALGGVSVDYLVNGSLNAERKRIGFSPIESKTFSITNDREKFNLSLILGAGIKYRLGGGYGVIEVRYNYGLLNANNKKDTYNNDELVFNYQAIDGIFKINSLSLTLGYVHNIFKPKKITLK
ncbi:MAG: PorT family protein [Cyclobacteriaceae bacterium]|nr:PorT family protein [Cyclobacteriaceae bacterium]